jgi:tetratricopeptide (TPR) repeat protein
MVLLLALLLQADPADQLRRQELALRLSELADAEKPDGFVRAVQRELRGPHIETGLYDDCWRPLVRRRGEGRLDALIAAWDRAAIEASTPARLLYRAKLEELASRPKVCLEKLEGATKKYPAEPVLLWHLGKSRFDAGERGTAASAFEQMASQKGAVFDVSEFHRLLVQCYAETERPWAAVEHLRAAKDEDLESVDLARLARKCRLPGEAARLYRIALAEEPSRISLRMGLILALNEAGERVQAAGERSKLCEVDGKFSAEKMQDYFFLLPAEGRAEEIVRTLRDRGTEPAAMLIRNVPPESRNAVMTEWERTVRDGLDWAVLSRMKESWSSPEETKNTLEKGEKLFPKDPHIVRERIEILSRQHQYKEVLEAYARLAELDPGSKQTRPCPVEAIQEALADQALKDIPTAMAAALRLLSEPGLSEEQIRATRAALKPGWDLSAADFWAQLKKMLLPKPPKPVEETLKAQIERLSADDFNDRAEAAQQLRKAGLPGVPVLLERIDDPDAEIRSRCREVIRAILTD